MDATQNECQFLPLFKGVPPAEMQVLYFEGRPKFVQADQHIFRLGDPADYIYIILGGAIQLSRRTPDGARRTSEILLKGDMPGMLELFHPDRAYLSDCTAVHDSRLFEIPSEKFKKAVQSNGMLALNILEIMAQRSHLLALEAEQKSIKSAPQQVACFLARLCMLHGFDPNGFDLPYSKTLIASRLGMELETFSRALSKVRDHGIQISGSYVSFADMNALENYICQACGVAENCQEKMALVSKLAQ